MRLDRIVAGHPQTSRDRRIASPTTNPIWVHLAELRGLTNRSSPDSFPS